MSIYLSILVIFIYKLVDVVKGLVRNWTEPSEPCIKHWCEDGDEKTKDLRQYCSCPPVS